MLSGMQISAHSLTPLATQSGHTNVSKATWNKQKAPGKTQENTFTSTIPSSTCFTPAGCAISLHAKNSGLPPNTPVALYSKQRVQSREFQLLQFQDKMIKLNSFSVILAVCKNRKQVAVTIGTETTCIRTLSARTCTYILHNKMKCTNCHALTVSKWSNTPFLHFPTCYFWSCANVAANEIILI